MENSRLLIDEEPMVLQPSLARLLGLFPAVVLQQVHYWVEIGRKQGDKHKYHDGHWWTYGTYEYWQSRNFSWASERTVRRAFRALEDLGVLVSGNYNRLWGDHTKWYRINYDELEKLRIKAESRSRQNDIIDEDNLTDSGENSRSGQNGQNRSGQNDQVRSGQNDQMIPETSPEISPETSFNLAASGDGKSKSRVRVNYASRANIEEAHQEPENVDSGNEFEDSNHKNPPKWRLPTGDVCERAFKATGRKHFYDRKQRSRWIKIEKAMMPLDLANKVKYPTEWVLDMIEWAEKRNKEKRSITFDALMSAIENEDRRHDWGARIVNDHDKFIAVSTAASGEDYYDQEADPWFNSDYYDEEVDPYAGVFQD